MQRFGHKRSEADTTLDLKTGRLHLVWLSILPRAAPQAVPRHAIDTKSRSIERHAISQWVIRQEHLSEIQKVRTVA